MNDSPAGPRPRLLVIASTYPRWRGDSEPGFVHELARRMTGRFDVMVVCPHAPGALARETLDGVDIVRFRYAPATLETLVSDGGIVGNLKRHRWKWLLAPLFLLGELLAIWRVLRQWRPDVVHAHWLIPQGFLLALLGLMRVRLPPYVVTSHGADLFTLRSGPFRWLKRAAIAGAARVTVVSDAMVGPARDLGASADRISVRPMGVDLRSRFVPGDETARRPDRILFVGRLVEKKGLRILLDAMPKVLAQWPDVTLQIAGFGPEEPALRAHADALGLSDRVHFLGAVPQADLPSLYRQATMFVAPFVVASSGDQEGLGLVMIEAAGCGCPVIASDLPAVRDVLDIRVPPGEPSALAAAITAELARPVPDRRAAAAALRSRLLDRFDWTGVAEGYADLLLSVAE